MPATLRLTDSGVNAVGGGFFLPRKKEGAVYTGGSRWGVVAPRGGVLPEANSLQSFNTLLTQINSR